MPQLFFADPAFEFETRTVLGNAHYGCADVGEVLATVAAITDGDDSSWVSGWQALATRTEAIATAAQMRGHSARLASGPRPALRKRGMGDPPSEPVQISP